MSGLCLNQTNQTENCKPVIAVTFPSLFAAVVKYFLHINSLTMPPIGESLELKEY